MDIAFYKLQCGTEDFILINCQTHPRLLEEYYSGLAAAMCKRRTGIGGEGVIFITALQPSIELELVLPDGTAGAFRTNALLCAARYLFDYGITGLDSFPATISGIKTEVEVIDSGNFRVRLNSPKNPHTGELLSAEPSGDYTRSLRIEGKELMFSPIQIFNDFTVHITDEYDHAKLISLSDAASTAEGREAQPVFLFIKTREECDVKFWKRGKHNFDFAGACAAAGVAGVLNGLLEREMVIRFRNQNIFLQWLERDDSLYITASPGYVFSGNYEFSGSSSELPS